jgi:hypothetical protein
MVPLTLFSKNVAGFHVALLSGLEQVPLVSKIALASQIGINLSGLQKAKSAGPKSRAL